MLLFLRESIRDVSTTVRERDSLGGVNASILKKLIRLSEKNPKNHVRAAP